MSWFRLNKNHLCLEVAVLSTLCHTQFARDDDLFTVLSIQCTFLISAGKCLEDSLGFHHNGRGYSLHTSPDSPLDCDIFCQQVCRKPMKFNYSGVYNYWILGVGSVQYTMKTQHWCTLSLAMENSPFEECLRKPVWNKTLYLKELEKEKKRKKNKPQS